MANEYDFMLKDKPMEVWDHFFEITMNYDHTKPGVTRCGFGRWKDNTG